MNAARRLAWLLAAMLWAAGARAGDNPQAEAENKIKATYIYKFASYVEWQPGEAGEGGTPFIIGIADADGLAEELKKLSTVHPLKNRPVQVRLLSAGAAPPGLQMLYIGQGSARRARGLLDSVAAQPVLTVTESAGLLAAGSVINLVLIDDRIRFEVSLPQAEARRLRISSRLLDVAYRIEGRQP